MIPKTILNRRVKCPTHKSKYCDIREGAEIGGLVGIYYNVCNSCGWQRAIAFKAPNEKVGKKAGQQ